VTMFHDKYVLIFDESVFMGRLLQTILSALEVGQTDICHDLSQVKEHIKETRYDCIFCDWSG